MINLPLVVALPVADRQGGSVDAARPTASAGSTSSVRRCACSASAVSVFALIEQPRLGWSNPAVSGSLIGGVLTVRGVPRLRIARERPDAAARPVQEPKLRGRERRDAGALRRPFGAVLLPRPVPAAGGRLLAAQSRAGAAAREPDHVRAVLAVRRARRSPRPAPVHGRRPADRRRGDAHAAQLRGPGRLPDRRSSPGSCCSRWVCRSRWRR